MMDLSVLNKGIAGSGGGGGGGGGGKKGGGQSDDNTRRTRTNFHTVEILSEGPIEGFIDQNGNLLTGDISKAIYLDQTPIRNTDGSYNFNNVALEYHVGLADEGHFKNVNGVETPVSVETEVKKGTGPVQRTIVEENATAIRVIMRIPALAHRNSKDGSIKTASVSYAIDVRAVGGSWVEAVRHSETNQKSISPYQIQHYIPLPEDGNPWDIRVRRLTDDAEDDSGLANETYWESYIVLVEGKFIYPHTAAFSMRANAEDMGSSLPTRSARIRGRRTKVPSNYNPITRQYTGIWNGTFKTAWHNNPAWVFYDLIENNRYGLGDLININTVDKWSLYTVGRYCDQLIPSGYKNQNGTDILEPRFTFNHQFTKRDEAYFTLQQVTTAWRGMAYWSLGQVFATADMPQDPIKLVTPANVIDGEFSYSGTALKARHTVVMVKFNNKDDFYRPDTEVVIDNAAVIKYGWREKSVTLTGATSRGQAHRYGKWILDTEQNATETVTYLASWDHAEVRPGNIIAISNPRRQNAQLGGRIVSASGKNIMLDRKFKPANTHTYSLMATLPDGSVETKPIVSFGSADNSLVLSAAYSTNPLVNAVFTITGSDIRPEQYRVLTVEEQKTNEFKVTALAHDPTKFARVERNVLFEAPPVKRDASLVQPPTSLRVEETGYIQNGNTRLNLMISWSPPSTSILWSGFDVYVDAPDGSRLNLGPTNGTSVDMRDVVAGVYTINVATIGITGRRSQVLVGTYEAIGPAGFSAPTVSDLKLADDATTTVFAGTNLRVTWKNNFSSSTSPTAADAAPAHITSPHYAYNTVKVYNDSTLLRTERVTGESYTYNLAMNAADCARASVSGPARSLRVEVSVTDIFSRTSAVASKTFTNPVPAALSPVMSAQGSSLVISYPAPADLDFVGVKVWVSDSSPVSTTGAPTYVGTNNPIVIPVVAYQTYFAKVAGYDRFGDTGLVMSSEIHATTSANVFDLTAPAIPEGLELNTRVVEIDGVAVRMVLTATVDENTERDFAYYDWEIRENGGNWVSFPSPSNVMEWNVSPETDYEVKVRAIDRAGNRSNRSDEEEITTPAHASLASLINSGSTTIDPGMIKISGATTLADWRTGGDETKINGGAIAANTVQANSMVIGQRGIHLEGVQFEANSPAANKVKWSAGAISYVADSGSGASVSVTAGDATWTAGSLYLYWTKGATTISATTSFSTAINASNVILAVYRGGKDLIVEYGRTVIDGDHIKTGSISATTLAVERLSALTANMGDITAGRMRSTDNKFVIDLDSKTISIEV